MHAGVVNPIIYQSLSAILTYVFSGCPKNIKNILTTKRQHKNGDFYHQSIYLAYTNLACTMKENVERIIYNW